MMRFIRYHYPKRQDRLMATSQTANGALGLRVGTANFSRPPANLWARKNLPFIGLGSFPKKGLICSAFVKKMRLLDAP